MSWVAVAVVGASALATGISAATAPGPPGAPNPSDSASAGVNAQLNAMPATTLLNAAAATGGSALRNGYRQATIPRQQALDEAQATVDSYQRQIANGEGGPWAATGLANAQQALKEIQASSGDTYTQYYDSGNVPTSKQSATADFSGSGTQQVANTQADQAAAANLAREQQYGPAMVNEALALEKQANPEGVAARDAQYQEMQAQQALKPDLTAATQLQTDLTNEEALGSKMDPVMLRQNENAILGNEAARGNLYGNAPAVAESAFLGQAGENLLNSRQGKLLAFETSGATPYDLAVKQNQLSQSNNAAFLNGQTPQNQFGQIAGASASPTNAGVAQGSYTANGVNLGQAAATGVAGANAAGQLALANFNSTVNPFLAGLNTTNNAIATAIKGLTPTGGQTPLSNADNNLLNSALATPSTIPPVAYANPATSDNSANLAGNVNSENL